MDTATSGWRAFKAALVTSRRSSKCDVKDPVTVGGGVKVGFWHKSSEFPVKCPILFLIFLSWGFASCAVSPVLSVWCSDSVLPLGSRFFAVFPGKPIMS